MRDGCGRSEREEGSPHVLFDLTPSPPPAPPLAAAIAMVSSTNNLGGGGAEAADAPRRSRTVSLIAILLTIGVGGLGSSVFHLRHTRSYILGSILDESSRGGGGDRCPNCKLLRPDADIELMGRTVGRVSRMCEGDHSSRASEVANGNDGDDGHDLPLHHCLLPNRGGSVNTPAPLRVRPWMAKNNPSLFGHDVFTIMYYSGHVSGSTIKLLTLEESNKGRRWKDPGVVLSFEPMPCQSVHSPSILASDKDELLIMYVHGHKCENLPDAKWGQPTLLYSSSDGVTWTRESFEVEGGNDLFYFTAPVRRRPPRRENSQAEDGHYYAMSRVYPTARNPHAFLLRSKELGGPWQRGPELARGLRHFDLHPSDDEAETGGFHVWFSMIGDAPERILLGSIDTTSEDWMDWKLLPGPRILAPERWYEHGRMPIQVSKEGAAAGNMLHQINKPRFLPDDDYRVDSAASSDYVMSGFLFYVVQGEKGVAVARVALDLASYRDAVSNRDRSNISPGVYNATSLPWDVEARAAARKTTWLTQLLVTGVGRTGTTSVCTLFQKFGIMVSHDNDVDCGPYPGPDGAVSWYDAFTAGEGRRYEKVIHLVREPLKTINSRIIKCAVRSGKIGFMEGKVKPYEEVSHNDTCASLSLKHWVRRNSFVEEHASWRIRSETFFGEQLTVWETCMAAEFGKRCPDLLTISAALAEMPVGLNSLYAGGTISKIGGQQKLKAQNGTDFHGWEDLRNIVGEGNWKYIRIAQEMARRYGYNLPDESDRLGYECMFTRRDGDRNLNWDCFIDQSSVEETERAL